VVRFCDDQHEVGFLVSGLAVVELLKALEYGPQRLVHTGEADPAAPPTARPTWPKMTAGAVWALICASLAFLPFIGVGFAAAAAVLIILAWTRLRATAVMLHTRWMLIVAGVVLAWGVLVSGLATWCWLTPPPGVGQGAVSVAPLASDGWTVRILALLVVLASLSVHEAAHAITAWWCGDDLARSLGRVTLNPMAHIDLFGTLLLPLLLASVGAPVFGYARPVPVRLEGLPRYRRAHILVAAAGPGSNLIMAAWSYSILVAVVCLLRSLLGNAALVELADPLTPIRMSGFAGATVAGLLLSGLKLTFLINVALAFFNLVPIPPLDGSWVLQHLFPSTLGVIYARLRPFGFLVFLALFWTGAFDYLLAPVLFVLGIAKGIIDACFG